MQSGTTSTTTYPSKFYSVASTTISGASWATTTSYVWLGDTLLSTIDQQFKAGTATGTAKTRYVHPDHLGSTNVVSDEGGNLVQTLDYFPYGATRVSTATSTNEKRKYIGQFTDDNSGLSYLNARYYDSGRGQFLSQDPVFWAKQNLSDPQSINVYSYALDNPITRKDPSGLTSLYDVYSGKATWNDYQVDVGQGAMILSQQSPAWNFAISRPYTTGALVGIASVPGLLSGSAATGAFAMAAYPGVGTTFFSQQVFAGLVYTGLSVDTTLGIPGIVGRFGQADPRKPTSILPAAGALAWSVGPSALGGYPGAIADAFQFGGLISQTLGRSATNLYSNSVQARTAAANTFNSRSGATSNESKLWVTPSGAVINWNGGVVSAPLKK